MKKTLLKFSSAVYLIAFRKFSKADYWEINLDKLTIICNCSEKELAVACKDFRAIQLSYNEVQPLTGIVGGFNLAQDTYPIISEKAS